MTLLIQNVAGQNVYDLVYADYLSGLPIIDQETMHRAMRNSAYTWLCTDDDSHIVCIWGLIAPTLLSDQAYLWMYTTKYLEEHIFLFIRHSQRALEQALELYPIICGHCVINNTKAIRWLRWLGAKFGDPHGHVLPFEIKAKQWPQV